MANDQTESQNPVERSILRSIRTCINEARANAMKVIERHRPDMGLEETARRAHREGIAVAFQEYLQVRQRLSLPRECRLRASQLFIKEAAKVHGGDAKQAEKWLTKLEGRTSSSGQKKGGERKRSDEPQKRKEPETTSPATEADEAPPESGKLKLVSNS